jgi:integrase
MSAGFVASSSFTTAGTRRSSAASKLKPFSILFLYKCVLNAQLPWLGGVVRASRPKRLPVVLTRAEVKRVLSQLGRNYWLIGSLLYGSGLRLTEALRLRVKDIDLERRVILVRDGKGTKDRVTVPPESRLDPLRQQLQVVRARHRKACRHGFAGVELAFALQGKYPRAHLEIGWQYVFPDARSAQRHMASSSHL